MPRRKDDPPYLRQIRAEKEVVTTARWLLQLFDSGERVPPSAWDELRLRLRQIDAAQIER